MNRITLIFLSIVVFFIHPGSSFSQTVPFSQVASLSLPSSHSDVHWGDYDNDGDLDLLATSTIFENRGSNNFVLYLSFSEVANKSNWGDINKDGRLDVIIASAGSTVIYLNQGGSFIKYPGLTLPGVTNGNFSLGDYDNDGDLDLMQTGESGGIAYTSVFRNDGSSFSEPPGINLQQISNGWCTWVDYDNDGDLDIHLTGYSGVTQSFARLYRNNGDGTFSDHITLDGSWRNSVTWGDTDGDGDLDAVTLGDGSKLIYRNNRGTSFTSLELGSLSQIAYPALDFGDVDNDGKPDLLITGFEYYVPGFATRILRNTGNNTFAEITGYNFPGIAYGGAEWGDYDADGDLDFAISGNLYPSGVRTYIYQNTGTLVNTPPSIPVPAGSEVDGADVILKWHPSVDASTNSSSISYNLEVTDSKGKILVPGHSMINGSRKVVDLGNAQLDTTFILKNLPLETYNWKVQAVDNGFAASGFSGSGSFAISTNTQSFNLNASDIQAETARLKWTRGNGLSCVVFMRKGEGSIADPADGATYTGNSVFGSGTDIPATGWYCVYNGIGTGVNVSGLTAGSFYQFQVLELPQPLVYLRETLPNNPFLFRTSLFNNKGPSGFLELTFPHSLDWGDYDKDGDLDLLYIGVLFGMTDAYGYIYRNNGNQTFTNTSITIDYLASGDAGWSDYDSDGDLDIFITGRTADSELRTYIYKNNGSGTFSKVNLFLEGITDGSAGWTDADNDGDLDIIESGSGPAGPIFRLLRNMGDDAFLEDNYAGLSNGDMKWGDLDNDDDIDIIMTGANTKSELRTIFLINDGNAKFSVNISPIPGFINASLELFDPDTDGDLDVVIGGTLLTGWNSDPVTKHFENKGEFEFTEVLNAGLMNIKNGSIEAGDLDNDGDPDLLLTGRSGTSSEPALKAKVYFSDGNVFTEQTNIALPDIYGSTAMADLDNDRDLDFYMNGSLTDGIYTSVLINSNLTPNSAPAVPSTPSSLIENDTIRLSWLTVSGDETPSVSISYNLGIGNSPGVYNILSPQSRISSRLVTGPGNMGSGTTMYITGLLPGTYYWIVQAVDYSFAAGNFTTEKSFTVPPIQASSLTGSIIDNSKLNLKWTGGNGERVIVFCKLGAYTAVLPVNGSAYLADQEFGYGDQLGTSGWYCVYNGRKDSCVVGGLLSSSYYQFMVLEYTGTGGSEFYFPDRDKGNVGQFGTSLFSVYTGTTFKGGYDGDVEFVDFNNDGFLDISVCGFSNYGNVAEIYLNNGDKTFTQFTAITDGALPALWDAEFTWGDFNNDLYPDFYLTGHTWQLKYINEGGTFFTKQADPQIPVLTESYSSLADYDHDNDLDLLFSGNELEYPAADPLTYLYRNTAGSFSKSSSVDLPQVYNGSVKWIDYDNDGDLDIFLSGSYQSVQECTIFENRGSDTFVRNDITGLYQNIYAEAELMDFQNDGLTDIMYSGGELILNNQTDSGRYSQKMLKVHSDKSKTGDLDNDGDADILITNMSNTMILINSGGEFTRADDIGIIPFSSASMALGDFDNDGDLDALLNGSTNTGRGLKLYQNNTIMKAGALSPNSLPEAPVNTGYASTPLGIKLHWSPAKDVETPSRTISYNVSIGTSAALENVAPSNSKSTGHRLIYDFGNAFYDTTHLIRHLPKGKYYWKVQAIDQNFAGGSWSAVDSFEVKNIQAFYSSDEVCLGKETHFTNQSVATAGIVSWRWDFNDGSGSDLQDPVHTYAQSGTYNVRLVVTDAAGIKDSLEKTVVVKTKPLTGFTAPSVCQGIPVSIENTTNNNGLTISAWRWSFGDGIISTNSQPDPHPYLTSKDYTIKLKAIATNGCADSVTNVVTVASYPVAVVSANAPLSFCDGDSVILSVPYNSKYLYNWKLNGTGLTNGDTSRFAAKRSGSYIIEIRNSAANCLADSPPVTINAMPAPYEPIIKALNYTPGKCPGENPVRLSADQTSDDYRYIWFKDGSPMLKDTLSFIDIYEAGNYRLAAIRNGCTAQSSPLELSFPDAFPKPVIFYQGPTLWYLACSNDTASAYKWYYNGNLISNALGYFYVANQKLGDYQVSIANKDGCYTRSDIVTIPPGYTNIDDDRLTGEIKIYPNPNKGLFTIDIDNDLTGEVTIKITTIDGKEIGVYKHEKNLSHFSVFLNNGRLSKGNYVVFISLNNRITVRKIIVE